MNDERILKVLEEGLENGRTRPYLAAYIAEYVLKIEARGAIHDEASRLDGLARHD